jgi:hypothetical protein
MQFRGLADLTEGLIGGITIHAVETQREGARPRQGSFLVLVRNNGSSATEKRWTRWNIS